MIDAMCQELILRSKDFSNQAIQTIYFGGGTPSLLSNQQLEKFLDTIRTHFDLSACDEITLESNPDDITAEKVTYWKEIGVNRLSIGIQSFDEQDLKWMNRAHSADQSLKSIRLAQENGITNLTIDLMYGLPEMSVERWRKQVETAIQTGVQHISAYCLTVEERTALYKKVQREELIPADQDLQSEQFDVLMNTLTTNGFIHYEISNFGKPDFFAKHNSNYWKNVSYIGIGPSAHSYDGKNRQWNIANNREYLRLIKENDAFYEIEELSPENRFNELLLTGLRTIWGVSIDKLTNECSLDEVFLNQIEKFKKENLLLEEAGFYRLTSKGKHLADYIAQELFRI